MEQREYCRFYDPGDKSITEGLVDRGEGILRLVDGSILDPEPSLSGGHKLLAGLTALPPVVAPLACATGLNYRSHAEETGMEIPTTPMQFAVDPGVMTGDGGKLIMPTPASLIFGVTEPYVDCEPEPVIIIGTDGKMVGLAAGNDSVERITHDEIFARNIAWTLPDAIGTPYEFALPKNLPTFKPIGSLHRGDFDLENIDITMVVNGETVQKGNTHDMIFSFGELIDRAAFVHGLDRLPAGTCIWAGTPPGVGYQPEMPERQRPSLKPGDTMTVVLSFGSVTTHVVSSL